jgi:hypothetical protein
MKSQVKKDAPESCVTWVAHVHIDRACELANLVESAQLGTADGMANATALARLHIEIAQAKMIGRMRVR